MSAINDTCNLGAYFWRTTSIVQFVAYQILPPVVLFVGLPGQIVSFISFLAQSKNEKAYAYQIYSSLSGIFELLEIVSNAQTAIWNGICVDGGSSWYVSSFTAMWFSAHLMIPLRTIGLTNSLLGSLFMSLDRLFALTKPFSYRNFKHRRNQWMAFTFCLFTSVSVSVIDYFLFYIKFDIDHYVLVPDKLFPNSTPSLILARVRDSIRVTSLSILIISNALIVYFYKKQGATASHFTSKNDVEKETKRKEREKNLFLLTVSQSVLIAVRVFASMAMLIVIYGVPELTTCGQRQLVTTVADVITQVCVMSEFYVCFGVSKQFRKNILQVLSFTKICGQKIHPAPGAVLHT